MILDCKGKFDIVCPFCKNNLGTFDGPSFKGARSIMMRCKCGMDIKVLFLADGQCDISTTAEKPALFSMAAKLEISEIEFHDISGGTQTEIVDLDAPVEPYPWAGCEATRFKEIVMMMIMVGDRKDTNFESVGITHTKGEDWVELIVKEERPEMVEKVAKMLPDPEVEMVNSDDPLFMEKARIMAQLPTEIMQLKASDDPLFMEKARIMAQLPTEIMQLKASDGKLTTIRRW